MEDKICAQCGGRMFVRSNGWKCAKCEHFYLIKEDKRMKIEEGIEIEAGKDYIIKMDVTDKVLQEWEEVVEKLQIGGSKLFFLPKDAKVEVCERGKWRLIK